ncbi:MAG: alpha/beta hydrolase family protein, partial [Phocaeicola sp.]
PKPFEKETTELAENRPKVQVWNWDEPVQYTVQAFNKKRDTQRSYQAVYNLLQGSVFQLAHEELPHVVLGDEAEASVALLFTTKPYSLSSMWESRTRHDYYVVSLESGERTLLSQADYTSYKLSPESNYAYGYAEADSCWYAWSLKDLKKHQLTDPRTFTAWNEENDVPAHPRAHGEAGWSKGDAQLYLYDRYDIWQLSPTNEAAPINLTRNGREKRESYRVIELDRKKTSSSHTSRIIDLKEKQLLLAFNEVTKGYAYYQISLQKPATPKFLLGGDYMLRTLSKAQKSKEVIYTMESFEKFPDLYYSDLTFKSSVKLTEGDKQQAPFLWGSAELISWRSLDGTLIEGVVYKPANFDPTKKYPLIVNFYERNATTLHNFRMPEPNRSTVDYHYYNSHEYILFNPDIHYRDGYPGESCYNCVMPGVTELVSKGYIDEARIGAQGHSWGGYQVAYLATRTNLFAAIESGAPVVNMFSAYGGIRWGSGLSRTYQYEHGQSRIAGTPWDAPLRFSSNSPLFTMDKVNTPILIMHNDKDGHVPWYQGIEYFVALKRLGKPCWMLNYVDEPHWPTLMPNKKDFQIRMAQFFDHYLKGSPMPEWMREGVPAVEEPYQLGY